MACAKWKSFAEENDSLFEERRMTTGLQKSSPGNQFSSFFFLPFFSDVKAVCLVCLCSKPEGQLGLRVVIFHSPRCVMGRSVVLQV